MTLATSPKTKAIFCLAQRKGGTAKTTSVANIAAGLAAMYGAKVIAINLDQQRNLETALGVEVGEDELTVFDLLTKDELRVDDVLRETNVPNVKLIPGSANLAVIDSLLGDVGGRERLLDRKLRRTRAEYDYIVIDTGPSYSLATLIAITASTHLIAPLVAEPFGFESLQELKQLVSVVQEGPNPNLRFLGTLLTRFKPRRGSTHNQIAEILAQDEANNLFSSRIRERDNNDTHQAEMRGKPIVVYRPKSELAQDYRAAIEEIVKRAK